MEEQEYLSCRRRDPLYSAAQRDQNQDIIKELGESLAVGIPCIRVPFFPFCFNHWFNASKLEEILLLKYSILLYYRVFSSWKLSLHNCKQVWHPDVIHELYFLNGPSKAYLHNFCRCNQQLLFKLAILCSLYELVASIALWVVVPFLELCLGYALLMVEKGWKRNHCQIIE